MLSNVQQHFSDCLSYQGRILELEDLHVWGTSGFVDETGKVHVYFSNWSKGDARSAWVTSCKVNYATADSITSTFVDHGTVLEGAGGDAWDAWSIHNPCVHKVGSKYVMLYMGSNGNTIPMNQQQLSSAILELEEEGLFDIPNSQIIENSKHSKDYVATIWDYYKQVVETKRIGMAIADSPAGPFTRVGSQPMIDTGEPGTWDDLVTSNPAFCVTPDQQYLLYYKAWNRHSWENAHGNRKYGVAMSDTLTGPYKKLLSNPIIDFEPLGNNSQLEDATVFRFDNQYHMVARDMGVVDHQRGIIMSSDDGVHFNEPVLAYHGVEHYSDETIISLKDMSRSGNYERPQIIKNNLGEPVAMIAASTGGKYATSTPALFLIDQSKLKPA